MVITGASQASDASSILVARSIAILQKSSEKAAFAFMGESLEHLKIKSFFQYFVQYI